MEQKQKRVVVKIGDIFCAEINGLYKVYFQYIMDDLSQLNSPIIRVFKTKYDISLQPTIDIIISDEIDFYAHVVVSWGVKMGLWYKVGKCKYEEQVELIFRSAKDFAYVNSGVSEQWVIWKPNCQRVFVGKLPEEYYSSETGYVHPPNEIITRISTGSYSYPEPRYK